MPDNRARFALRSFAATVLVSLCAAAPAAATIVTISGSPDVRTCFVVGNATTDLGGACNQALIGASSGFEFRGLIHFDVAAHVPTGSSVTGATLRLPLNGFDDDEICDSGLHLRAQDADWLGQTPNWTTPDGGTTFWEGGSLTWSPRSTYGGCNGDAVEFDVTGQVGDWVNFPVFNLGWTIVSDSGTTFGVGNTYTDIPELVIDFS